MSDYKYYVGTPVSREGVGSAIISFDQSCVVFELVNRSTVVGETVKFKTKDMYYFSPFVQAGESLKLPLDRFTEIEIITSNSNVPFTWLAYTVS